jgi:hypothetical protein
MTEQDDGGPAFPVTILNNTGKEMDVRGHTIEHGQSVTFHCLSVRDYFAAKAMPIFSGIDVTSMNSARVEMDFTNSAVLAYAYADAMLQARKK